MFLDVRLVIAVSINICFGSSYFYHFIFVFVFNIVTGLILVNLTRCEILGWPLSDPIACEMHGVSQER